MGENSGQLAYPRSKWILSERRGVTLDRGRGVKTADSYRVQGVEVDSLREDRGDLGRGGRGVKTADS